MEQGPIHSRRGPRGIAGVLPGGVRVEENSYDSCAMPFRPSPPSVRPFPRWGEREETAPP
jgi:hypothetical protein